MEYASRICHNIESLNPCPKGPRFDPWHLLMQQWCVSSVWSIICFNACPWLLPLTQLSIALHLGCAMNGRCVGLESAPPPPSIPEPPSATLTDSFMVHFASLGSVWIRPLYYARGPLPSYFRHLLMKFAWVVGALGEARQLPIPADGGSGCGLLESRGDVWPPLQ